MDMELPFKQSYKTMLHVLTALGVYNVGHQKCTPLYQWGPGVRNHYVIHYVVAGKGYYLLGGQRYEIHAGEAFLIVPDTEITYHADEIDPWEYVWVGFAGADAQPILQCTPLSEKEPVLHLADGETFRKAIERIYEARGADFNHAVRMTGELYTALSLLMRDDPSHRAEDVATQYVQKAATYIAHHYAYPITVLDVASYVGIDRSHLYTVFKQVLGVSPKDYLTDFRIRKACTLLREPELSITAAANSVGFENNLYFSKVFRKRMGVTPSQYRQTMVAPPTYDPDNPCS